MTYTQNFDEPHKDLKAILNFLGLELYIIICQQSKTKTLLCNNNNHNAKYEFLYNGTYVVYLTAQLQYIIV